MAFLRGYSPLASPPLDIGMCFQTSLSPPPLLSILQLSLVVIIELLISHRKGELLIIHRLMGSEQSKVAQEAMQFYF